MVFLTVFQSVQYWNIFKAPCQCFELKKQRRENDKKNQKFKPCVYVFDFGGVVCIYLLHR